MKGLIAQELGESFINWKKINDEESLVVAQRTVGTYNMFEPCSEVLLICPD